MPASLPRFAPKLLIALAIGLAACSREQAPDPAPARKPAKTAAAVATAQVALADVLETTPTHIVGISFPPGLAAHPELAAEARRFSDAARAQVADAVRRRPADPALAPYELSLEFKLRSESPRLVVLAVDGSSYTGGAHGTPLIQRWTWLPGERRMLRVAELFPDPVGLQAVQALVRAQLRDAVGARLTADAVPPGERETILKAASAHIDGGTAGGAADFAIFEPVPDADGRIASLRFVFPPYQVGNYSDGMHSVELPAAVLAPHLAPRWKPLFTI